MISQKIRNPTIDIGIITKIKTMGIIVIVTKISIVLVGEVVHNKIFGEGDIHNEEGVTGVIHRGTDGIKW